AGSRPFMQTSPELSARDRLPLHRSFATWGQHQRSPGIVTPQRIWLGQDDNVIFRFENGDRPTMQSAVGAHAGLAAWLVLLDKFVETQTLLTEAAQIWPVNDMAGALAFVSSAFLPRPLLSLAPNNWERVARSLSIHIANSPRQHVDARNAVSH
ncbi:MAG: hypothetical protein KDD84_19760, partial [Caldilineaceae bacterium]|nr:hypothetical protein [Caldilineaceae bacterium]